MEKQSQICSRQLQDLSGSPQPTNAITSDSERELSYPAKYIYLESRIQKTEQK